MTCLQNRFEPVGLVSNNGFGTTIDFSTSTTVVGAPFDDAGGNDAGAAYVYRLQGAGFVEIQKLVGSQTVTGDAFGRAVANGDDVAIVGAPLADVAGFSSAGEAYIYFENAGVWFQTPVRQSPSPSFAGSFGFSVDISNVRAVIGSPLADSTPDFPGAVFVYGRQPINWPLMQELIPSLPVLFEGFGTSVAMAEDTLFVGTAVGDRVYVFEWNGSSYQQTQILFPSPPEDTLAINPRYLAADGARMVAAAPGSDVDGIENAGRVYVFEKQGGFWSQAQVLDDPFARPFALFGDSVSIDGSDVIVGKPFDGDEAAAAGAVYFYTEQGGALELQSKYTDGASSTASGRLGASVAISGGLVLASAPGSPNALATGEVHFIDSVFCTDPGTVQCISAACPCGNDDPRAGCRNSTGFGARLRATGSTSVADDDLRLIATGCPPNNSGLFFAGDSLFAPPLVVGDGLGCTGGLAFRYFPGTVDANGTFIRSDLVADSPPGFIASGVTRHFQAWTRDVLCGPPPAPCPSPCGANSNLSNAYSVDFVP